MNPYPLTFEPILKEKIWGGRRLEHFGKELPSEARIGESWELADLPSSILDGQSVIANGSIYVGLKAGTTEDALRNAIASDTVPELLNVITVKKGECYYLPSGTCHALGAGVLVAEVQTPSDTTFRVWDWGRTGRELHVDQAMECIDFDATQMTFNQPKPLMSGNFVTTHFVDTPFFSIERIESTNDTVLELVVDKTPTVVMVVEGDASIEHNQRLDTPVGTTILLPAGLTHATMSMPKGTAILRFDLPAEKVIA